MSEIYPGAGRRIVFPNPAEELTGMVQGKKASDLEERAARSLEKLPDWGYTFRIRINPVTHGLSERFTNLKGELELDFLLRRGNRLIPVEVDGEIGHFYAAWMKDVDREKTALIDKEMRKYNAQPTVRVEYWHLANQAMSDQYFRELLQ